MQPHVFLSLLTALGFNAHGTAVTVPRASVDELNTRDESSVLVRGSSSFTVFYLNKLEIRINTQG